MVFHIKIYTSRLDDKELRDVVDRKYRVGCMGSRTLTDQNYLHRKQKTGKPAMRWKVPISKPKEFKILADPHGIF